LFFVKPIEIYYLFQKPFAQANTAIKMKHSEDIISKKAHQKRKL